LKKFNKFMQMPSKQSQRQQGFTLVELMVALALSLLVVLASVSALLVSRQGFTSVDAASQLRDNARFATDFITRLAVQSGFKDVAFVDTVNQSLFSSKGVTADPDPPIFGFNNAELPTGTDPIGAASNDSRNSNCSITDGTACANGSDILVMRYQTGSTNTDSALGSLEVDNAMFNCAGVPQSNTPTSSTDVIESILFVGISQTTKEPALMCRYRNNAGTTWAASAPLVEGVESFQVLYGTDGVVPNTVPVAAAPLGTAPAAGQPDSIPERYLRADQLTVAGNTAATNENWRRVRSLRIGLIIRGAAGSAQDRGVVPALAPLGDAFVSSADKQTSFIQTPLAGAAAGTGDGRARQVVTFTVYLHNYQGI
jgi:type IV pilus assembly protein PilW